MNQYFDCNPFAFLQINNNSNNTNTEKPYFFSFANTLLSNVKNTQVENDEKTEEKIEENNTNKYNHIDYTKMSRFNIKFQNPYTKSKIFF